MLSLNRYREYFDMSSKEGIALLNNPIYNFQSPLEGADKDTQYGYDFIVTPGINPGDPGMSSGSEGGSICWKHSLRTTIWGDSTFVDQYPQIIRPLSQAAGNLSNHTPPPPRLTDQGKDVMRDRIQSKIMAFQLLELLSPVACQAVELQSKLFTWKSADGRQEESPDHSIEAINRAIEVAWTSRKKLLGAANLRSGG